MSVYTFARFEQPVAVLTNNPEVAGIVGSSLPTDALRISASATTSASFAGTHVNKGAETTR